MSRLSICACPGLALIIFFLTSVPATAYKWPGQEASLGGAISAEVIGQRCPGVLSASEVGELDAYIVKVASELAKQEETKKKDSGHRPFSYEEFRNNLTGDYEKKLSDPKNCNADAAEEAQDMLQRVRKAMTGGQPLLSADDRPKYSAVIMAKLTGEKCEGALTALELAELELYCAKYLLWMAKNATDEDARYTMQKFREGENQIASGWGSGNCNAEAVSEAKDVVARVRAAEK
jgi:hypothetical protein